MSEKACGRNHRYVKDAIECVERHKQSQESFGSITEGINLWWGRKYTQGMRNIGFVIGLWNEDAGIRWRLDYDEKKGAHLNQETKVFGVKHWDRIYHPIRFMTHSFIYCEEDWVVRWWKKWTENNTDKVPDDVLRTMKKWKVSMRSRTL